MNTEHAAAPLDDPLMATGSDAPDANLAALLDAEGVRPLDGLGQTLQQHHSTLVTYCTLALQPTLAADDETRLGEILAQAVDDPLLSFWLDEVDSWVSEQLELLPKETLKQQQGKLRRIIGQTWVDTLWQDLQNRTKALQAYLKRAGVYSGAIDGVVGPSTKHAIESLKLAYPDDLPLGCL